MIGVAARPEYVLQTPVTWHMVAGAFTVPIAAHVVADAGDPATMPAVGLYTGAGTNSVRTDGVAEGLVGLPLDVPLFIAVGGGLTDTAPSLAGETVQRLGKSIGTTNVFVEPGIAVLLVA